MELKYPKLKKIEQAILNFNNPLKFVLEVGKNILFHGIAILNDIYYMISDIVYKKWEDCGLHLGHMIHKIFLGSAY